MNKTLRDMHLMKIRQKLYWFMEFIGFKQLPVFYRAYPPKLHIRLLDRLGCIDHPNKFVYFRIFKAAHSTVIASLYHAQCGDVMKSLDDIQPIKDSFYTRPSQLSAKELAALQDSYFKFTFVRNPYTRVLSAYIDKVVPQEQWKHKMVARFLGKPENADISLDDFLTYLEAGGINQNAHWARQVDLIPMPLQELNFIGKLESLSEHLKYVLVTIFGTPQQIISMGEHATRSSRIVKELDFATQARIYKLYEVDFELFNYDKRL